jgi:hypothetical protein
MSLLANFCIDEIKKESEAQARVDNARQKALEAECAAKNKQAEKLFAEFREFCEAVRDADRERHKHMWCIKDNFVELPVQLMRGVSWSRYELVRGYVTGKGKNQQVQSPRLRGCGSRQCDTSYNHHYECAIFEGSYKKIMGYIKKALVDTGWLLDGKKKENSNV